MDNIPKWAAKYHRLIETLPPCTAMEQIRSERRELGLHCVRLQHLFSFFNKAGGYND
jgi:hypothetical protein